MIEVVAAAIVRHGVMLAARRSYPASEAGRWEFPGGKVGDGEGPERALTREIAEELGCSISVVRWLPEGAAHQGVDAAGRSITIRLRVAVCSLSPGSPEPYPREHNQLRWLGPEQLDDVDWLDADRPFLAALRDHLLDGEPLPGGNVGGAVRIGDTVRRPTGPWTPAVHAYLDHLHTSGLPAVPRVLGKDERGREVLEFLPGTVIDVDRELLTQRQLDSLGHWLRALHEASRGFDHPGPWRFFGVARPTLITHNDVAPYNICFDGDRLSGVFDWDLAGPSTPTMDLGMIGWASIPLYRPTPTGQAADRLRRFAAAYGIEPDVIANAVEPRIRLAINGVRTAAANGDAGMQNLRAAGEPERTEVALAGLLTRLPEVLGHLRR